MFRAIIEERFESPNYKDRELDNFLIQYCTVLNKTVDQAKSKYYRIVKEIEEEKEREESKKKSKIRKESKT